MYNAAPTSWYSWVQVHLPTLQVCCVLLTSMIICFVHPYKYFCAAAESPLLASFDLPAGDRVIFDPVVTAVTVRSRTITFQFKVNGVAAVQYRLDQFNGSKAFSGIYPVYDPIILYNVTISKACNGLLLVEPSYTLWYWATDVYGRSSPPLSASIVLG